MIAMLCEDTGAGRWYDARRGALIGAMAIAIPLLAACGGESPKSDRALDPANELPSGRVDTPVEGAQVPAQVAIGGWALDDRGIREVRVYVDGHLVTSTPQNTDRPDVSKAFAPYARGTNLHGWTTSVVFDAPGPHTIIVQAVDSDGATRDIGMLAVTSLDQ